MKKINSSFILGMQKNAESSPRLRSHHNFHPDLTDSVNRLCIFLKKGTYIRPHRHAKIHKWELIIGLKGQIGVVIYNDDGEIVDKFKMAPDSDMLGFEIQPNTWHALYALSDESMFFEVKPGPFIPTPEIDFANWAPKEGDSGVGDFLAWQAGATIGQKFQLES